jgi:hypothetical protein
MLPSAAELGRGPRQKGEPIREKRKFAASRERYLPGAVVFQPAGPLNEVENMPEFEE